MSYHVISCLKCRIVLSRNLETRSSRANATRLPRPWDSLVENSNLFDFSISVSWRALYVVLKSGSFNHYKNHQNREKKVDWNWFLLIVVLSFWIILDSRPEYSQCCHQDRGHHQIHHRRKEFSVSEISFRSSSELKPEGFNGWEEKEKYSPFLGSWAAGQLVSNKDNKVS